MFDFLTELGPLPFFTVGPWEFGPVKIHSFGLMVAIGVLLGHTISIRRVGRFGHDADAARSLYMSGLLMGFACSHILNVLMYEPALVLEDPFELLRFNGSLSSYGGVIGAFLGVGLWKRFHPNTDILPLIEPVFFAVPFGWFWGRVGCALVHDHPGRLTDFFLAVNYDARPPGGIRHDLGLYEAIWWFILIIVFFTIDRVKGDQVRKPYGFYGPLLAILYAPARFTLDFLRIQPNMGGDTRYFGLTPAQYISMFFFVIGIFFMHRWVKAHRAWKEDGEPDTTTPKGKGSPPAKPSGGGSSRKPEPDVKEESEPAAAQEPEQREEEEQQTPEQEEEVAEQDDEAAEHGSESNQESGEEEEPGEEQGSGEEQEPEANQQPQVRQKPRPKKKPRKKSKKKRS